MNYNFLDSLSLSELERLKFSLSSGDEITKKLLEEIDRKITFKKNVEFCVLDFSSDRMPDYRSENEERCLELLSEIQLIDLPFLEIAMSRVAKGVNLMSFLPISKIDKNLTREDCTLISLDNFFKDLYNVECHEGVYNTFNYIKNYIYYLLMNNSNLDKNGVFADYDEKYQLVSERIADIASYLYEIRKDDISLKLSIGNAGLYGSTRRVDTDKPLSRFQGRFALAVAFGSSYEKIEKRDYEDCKRLLFVERERKKR